MDEDDNLPEELLESDPLRRDFPVAGYDSRMSPPDPYFNTAQLPTYTRLRRRYLSNINPFATSPGTFKLYVLNQLDEGSFPENRRGRVAHLQRISGCVSFFSNPDSDESIISFNDFPCGFFVFTFRDHAPKFSGSTYNISDAMDNMWAYHNTYGHYGVANSHPLRETQGASRFHISSARYVPFTEHSKRDLHLIGQTYDSDNPTTGTWVFTTVKGPFFNDVAFDIPLNGLPVHYHSTDVPHLAFGVGILPVFPYDAIGVLSTPPSVTCAVHWQTYFTDDTD